MYGAGDIWENHIHPEDREAYHKGIEELFSGALNCKPSFRFARVSSSLAEFAKESAENEG
jgi:hypothetical protein